MPNKAQPQFINGPSGQIELVFENPQGLERPVVGVICHPHPLFGGTMNNKVVTTTARALQELGLATVRFNFRGVGKSEGTYDAARGEVDDLLAVLTWARETMPPPAFWLAGFSFGSCIAFQGSLRWPCTQLITLAPPIMRFDFTQANSLRCPWLLVQGDKDEIVDPEAVFAWANSLKRPVQVICMKGAGHFFHGKLIELRENIVATLKPPRP